jgi:membrane protein YqaA with SNARE-associated domain
MATWDLSPGWLLAASYGGAVVSAVIPWVNAELMLLAALPLATADHVVGALVVVVALGQMTGKSGMYWLARGATRLPAPRMEVAVRAVRTRLERHPRSAVVLVLVSAVFGVPPFYVMSVAAGSAGLPFARFAVAGGVGRLVHFGLLAFLPAVVGWGRP